MLKLLRALHSEKSAGLDTDLHVQLVQSPVLMLLRIAHATH